MKKKSYYYPSSGVSTKRVVHHIISFILALILFLCSFSTAFLLGFLNNNSVKKVIENQDYYKGIKESIISRCKSVAIPSDVDVSIFDSVFTIKTIESDVKEFIDATLDGEQSNIDVSDTQKLLKATIIKSLKNSSVKNIKSLEKDIDTFCNGIMKSYKNCIVLPYAQYYGQIHHKAFPLALTIVLITFFIAIVIGTVMMLIYHFKVVHKSFRMLSYSFTASGIMVFLIGIYLKLTIYKYHIQLKPEYLYNALQQYLSNGTKSFITMAFVLVAIGIAFAIISESLRNHVKKNYYNCLEDNFKESLNEEIGEYDFDDNQVNPDAERRMKEDYEAFEKMADKQLSGVSFDISGRDKKDIDFVSVTPKDAQGFEVHLLHHDFQEIEPDAETVEKLKAETEHKEGK